MREGAALQKLQERGFDEGLGYIMELLKTPLVSELMAAEQKRDVDDQFAGAEKSVYDDLMSQFAKTGRGRDAAAQAGTRRLRRESAGARSKARTDIDTNAVTLNRNAALQTFVQLLSGMQLQQQPYFQKMAAMSGGAANQAQIAAANAIHNAGPDLSGIGELAGAIPGVGTYLQGLG